MMYKVLSVSARRTYSLYSAFAADPGGGSHVAVIENAAEIPLAIRQEIARQIGKPATCFVDHVEKDALTVQFFSTKSELPMCGHGTIGLMSHAVARGWMVPGATEELPVYLHLKKGTARVGLRLEDDGRPRVMVSITPSVFRPAEIDQARLARSLGLTPDAFSARLPCEVANGDFNHLILPFSGLPSLKRITPDFEAIAEFSRDIGVDTVTAFTTETERPESAVRLRDFCPAVGVDESAAAGTTNAALSSYFVRHGLARGSDNHITIVAEQGMEIGQPSRIWSEIDLRGEEIEALSVGGVALKLHDGAFEISA